MKKLGKTLIIFAGILILLLLVMVIKMGSELKGLQYSEVNMNEVEDGVYIGKAETTLVKVEVEVEVLNHKISEIKIIRHDNGRGAKAEQITKDMIVKNTYDVDVISGATTSSEVFKSAVSNALAGG